jgi:hypothetical protein
MTHGRDCCVSRWIGIHVLTTSQVEAEAVDEVTEKFDVSTVPYFVLLKVRLA